MENNLMDRDIARKVGRETLSILGSRGYRAPSGRHVDIGPMLDGALVGTVEYPPELLLPLPVPGAARTRIAVENDTALSVGCRLARTGPVAALNFASATAPGGGFLNGARAQEESIARSSGLFFSLEGRKMYSYHQARLDAMY